VDRDVLGTLLSKVSTLQCAAAESEATRRKMHNQLMELRGSVSATAPRPDAFTWPQGPFEWQTALLIAVAGVVNPWLRSLLQVTPPQALHWGHSAL